MKKTFIAMAILIMFLPIVVCSRSAKLSVMSENKCIEFIIGRSVEIPIEFQNDELGKLVKDIIVSIEDNFYHKYEMAISWNVINFFIADIRQVVYEYYGIDINMVN